MATPRDKRHGRALGAKAGEDQAMPPKTLEEEMKSREIVASLEEMTQRLRGRNLANAVLLAQQAAGGRGPLVEHFAEIGRRFGHLLRAPQKTVLRVVEGGKS